MFPSALPWGTLRVSGKQSSLFPLGLVTDSKCFVMLPNRHFSFKSMVTTTHEQSIICSTLVPSVFVPLTSGRERTTLERSDLKSENSGLPVELRMPNVHCASFRRSFNIILLVSTNPEINMAKMAISSSATSLSDVEQQGVNFALQVNRKKKCYA